MSRSRVQVLTLAEIAFTLLFVLIILQISEGRRNLDERERLKRDLERTEKQLTDARAALEEERKKRTDKLSNIPERCGPEPLERLTVITPNELLIGDTRLDARAIASKHREALRQAEAKKCKHFVLVSWPEALPASDLDAALRPLERYFYIRRAGSVAVP